MGPSYVFRKSSLDDIDNIALFKNVFLPKSSWTRNSLKFGTPTPPRILLVENEVGNKINSEHIISRIITYEK